MPYFCLIRQKCLPICTVQIFGYYENREKHLEPGKVFLEEPSLSPRWHWANELSKQKEMSQHFVTKTL